MSFPRLGLLALPLALGLSPLLAEDQAPANLRPTIIPAPRPRLVKIEPPRGEAKQDTAEPSSPAAVVIMPAPAAVAAADGQPAMVSTRETIPSPPPLLPYFLARPGASARTAKTGTENRAQFRRAVLDTHPYTPIARAEPEEESIPILLTRTRTDPDVLLMPKFEVFADEVDRGLHQAILNYRDPRPINHTRFGTGVRQKDFGKVRAGVVTILYIPIMVGISW